MFQINSRDLSPVSVIEWLGVTSVLVCWRTSKAVGSVPNTGISLLIRYDQFIEIIFSFPMIFYFVSIGYTLKKLWYFKFIGYKVQNVSLMA